MLPSEKDEYFLDVINRTWGLHKKGFSITVEQQKKLEKALFEKVRQRTVGLEDEGKTIKKILKLYDIKDTGGVTLAQFTKALTSIGCAFTEAETKELSLKFIKLGSINIEEISNYYSLIGSGSNLNFKPKFETTSLSPLEVIAKIKKQVISGGLYGVNSLGRSFRKADSTKSGKLCRKDFSLILQENAHSLSSMEIDKILNYFDGSNTGFIDYNEFMKEMRGELSIGRKARVEEMYKRLMMGMGTLKLEEMLKHYNVAKHLKVDQ